MIGFETDKPTGYGRLLERDGELIAIREEKDATPEERRVTFCNSVFWRSMAPRRWICSARSPTTTSKGSITSPTSSRYCVLRAKGRRPWRLRQTPCRLQQPCRIGGARSNLATQKAA